MTEPQWQNAQAIERQAVLTSKVILLAQSALGFGFHFYPCAAGSMFLEKTLLLLLLFPVFVCGFTHMLREKSHNYFETEQHN